LMNNMNGIFLNSEQELLSSTPARVESSGIVSCRWSTATFSDRKI
jgi:hypothetical protein